MSKFNPVDEHFESRIRSSFYSQQLMVSLEAKLAKVVPGEVHIEMPFGPSFTQQHGYIHAGIITSIVDSACGFAAYTLMPADSNVLTVEYKVNFLAPAKGERFVGMGKVVKAGRTLTVCSGEVMAYSGNEERLIATMQATMMAVAK